MENIVINSWLVIPAVGVLFVPIGGPNLVPPVVSEVVQHGVDHSPLHHGEGSLGLIHPISVKIPAQNNKISCGFSDKSYKF